MVCSKLHLKAIRRGLPAGQGHDTCIVDQEIKGMSRVYPLREVGDRCKVGQIEMFVAYLGAGHFAADLLDSRLPLPIVATGENDLRAGLGQGQGCLETEAARSSRDNGGSAELRRDLCRTSHQRTCSMDRSPRLLSDQRDLQVGGAVLLGIKAAAVDIAGAPEQHIPSEIYKVVLHEVRSFLQSEWNKALCKYTLGHVDRPETISIRRDFIEHVGKSLRERSDLVALI